MYRDEWNENQHAADYLLGLFAQLALVSGDCSYEPTKVKDFDWNKFTGPRPWYIDWNKSSEFEKKIDCLKCVYSSPEGKRSLVTSDMYDICEQRHITTYGNLTKWNCTGYFEVHHSAPTWNGRLYILAVDYDRYFIVRLCSFDSNKTNVYVGLRSHQPDVATKEEVLKELKKNNIDVSHLLQWTADHCQQVELSKRKKFEDPNIDTVVGNRKHPSTFPINLGR